MANCILMDSRGVLASLLLCCTGCAAQWCHLPDDCAHVFYQTQLGWELQDVCSSCPLERSISHCGDGCDVECGVYVDDEAVWLDEPPSVCAEPVCHRPRLAVGPPPEPYRPPMPPKFLPVPTRSVFTNVNPAAPMHGTGQVEVGYGNSLEFPAAD